MNGKHILNKVILVLVAFGCLSVLPAYAASPVAVFLSSDEEAYLKPLDTFNLELNMPIKIFNLHGDIKQASKIMSRIHAEKPRLIFALGAKAAYISKLNTGRAGKPDIPVIFAMVINWERYKLLEGQKNIAGIESSVAPGTQFYNMALFFPDVKRVGVIYSKTHSSEIIQKADMPAGLLGLELVQGTINKSKDFKRVYTKMAGKIDGFWILKDPVVYTVDNMRWLHKQGLKDNIVTIGQSKNIAKMGVALAVNTDDSTIGSQAATLAKDILLRGKKPHEIGVVPPVGTRITLNMETVKKIGLEINEMAKNMATEIIGK